MFRFLFVSLLMISSTLAMAQDRETKRQEAIGKAIAFLRTQQLPDGSFAQKFGVGPTAVILCGLMDVGVKPDDPMVAKGLGYLKGNMQEDGGVYTKDGFFQNYETCLSILCFTTANKGSGGAYNELLAKAQKYILSEQFTEESKGTKKEDPFYGGAGYGKNQRPDLSNTQFFLEALKATGKGPDDPAIQKALVFVSRCQNLESEHNSLPFASKNPDGGFIYTGATQQSPAGETADGGLRSYASMTYAGLKSMIYAGLDKDDKRVKAAFDWITKNYTVKENPGMDQQGLYYYYRTMSKALGAMKVDEVTDKEGKKHSWKNDLTDELLTMQKPNGSWVNDAAGRWMEDNANLVTGYVLMALADCAK